MESRSINTQKTERGQYQAILTEQARSIKDLLYASTPSRSINTQKKERGQYQAILTEQAWSIKDLLYGFWGNFSCGTRRVVPSG